MIFEEGEIVVAVVTRADITKGNQYTVIECFVYSSFDEEYVQINDDDGSAFVYPASEFVNLSKDRGKKLTNLLK